jgi:hypothetical protein
MLAARSGSAQIVQALLVHGADRELRTIISVSTSPPQSMCRLHMGLCSFKIYQQPHQTAADLARNAEIRALICNFGMYAVQLTPPRVFCA